ncbi:MAG TPA: proteasome accessory factor PafA2 family protein [Pirellulaceae bacterium]|nr:proteasome accessory factor PafA2 family protein [Pirellulaceae bacterium]
MDASVFRRFCGLETEYAIRHPEDSVWDAPDVSLDSGPSFADGPNDYRCYRGFLASLRRRIPFVKAYSFKEGVFLANGGALWFETINPSSDRGLIEGATPECRGPRQLLAHQRAQDRLFREATRDTSFDGNLRPLQFRLIKNDCDGFGNVYGAQENYEATLATGWRLFLWRVGVTALAPALLLTWVFMIALIAGMFVYLVGASLIWMASLLLPFAGKGLHRTLFGQGLFYGDERLWKPPHWLSSFMWFAERALTFPLAAGLYLLCRSLAFQPTRSRMTAFLLTRPILGGAGWLAPDGGFQLSDKAHAINCLYGYSGYFYDRPAFNFGHFFKLLYTDTCTSPRSFFRLFHPRQRMQLSLGDSNRCETSEYLRIGTTLLVLDAGEAGYLDDAPRFRRPFRSHRDVLTDHDLKKTHRVRGGESLTAIDIQRRYLEGCRRFVLDQEVPNEEALRVLDLWERTLRDLAADPTRLVGTLDWVTKKYLLDGADEDLSWEARKKIDIRYHELSEESYFDRLDQAGLVATILEPEEIERAMRVPPPDSPATLRSHYIREFADDSQSLLANWTTVYLGRGRSQRVVDLDRRRAISSAASPDLSENDE